MPTVEEVLRFKRVEEPQIPALITIESHQKVGEAIDLMQRYSISQLPVVRNEPTESLADVIGSLQERGLLDRVFRNPGFAERRRRCRDGPAARGGGRERVDRPGLHRTERRKRAVVVARAGRPMGMLTRADLLEYLAHHRDGARR